MLNKYIFSIFFLLNSFIIVAQNDFYSKGTLQYEYKVNNHKNVWWGDDDFEDENSWKKEFIENTPKFSTYYYTLKFADNKSLFSYKGKEETLKKMWNDDSKEEESWYTDFSKQQYIIQKNIFGETFKLEDSLRKIKWKLIPNDSRDFAGFNCKKAVGIIYDSVYVFAYYCDAFTLPAGPLTINGLPGTILGITIPRMFISCVATSFTPLVNIDEIQASKKGKVKPTAEIYKKIKDATKDWGKWGVKGIWGAFL